VVSTSVFDFPALRPIYCLKLITLWANCRLWANQRRELSRPLVIHIFAWIMGNNGRLGQRAAVWLHRSKSVSVGKFGAIQVNVTFTFDCSGS